MFCRLFPRLPFLDDEIRDEVAEFSLLTSRPKFGDGTLSFFELLRADVAAPRMNDFWRQLQFECSPRFLPLSELNAFPKAVEGIISKLAAIFCLNECAQERAA